MAKTINTRIQLKYDTLSNWQTSNPILLAGEIACVSIGEVTTDNEGNRVIPPIMMKVGPGAFNDLGWTAAKAADVYSWAKSENKPTYNADEIEGLAEFIGGKVEDSNDNTTYSFEIVDNNLVVKATPHTLGEAGEETVVATLALVSDAEFAEYKTANDAEVAKKLNASEETGFVYSNGTTTPVVRTDVITKDEEVEVNSGGIFLCSPRIYQSGDYTVAGVNISITDEIKTHGITIVKNDNANETDTLSILNVYEYGCFDFYFTNDSEEIRQPSAIIGTELETLFTTVGTITLEDLGRALEIDNIDELSRMNIKYDGTKGAENFSFYTGENTIISTSYSDLVLKVYDDNESITDLITKIDTNTTNIGVNAEAIETLNTSLEEFKTDTNSALANKASTSSVSNLSSTVNNKLNKVSTEGFLYSDGTVTPSTRTDVITEQYRKLYKGTGEQLIDYNDPEYYSEEYNRIYSSWHSLPVYILNISDSIVTVNCSLNHSSNADPGYVYKSDVNNISILPGEGYLWVSVQEDYNYEGFNIDFTTGTPSQVVLYSEETEFKDINYLDLANQVSTNESNIATLTETVADHEERVTKVETFFETAEGETLDTALDTLVEIQKYITDEGSAADEMVKDIADHENRIKAIEDAPYATTANVATAKGEAIADAEGKVNTLKTSVEDGTVVAAKATEASDYIADGAIDTAIKAASKAGTDAAAAVEAGIEDGTIVAAKATVADTANDLSAALDEEIAGLIATAKSGAEATAAADAKSKVDAALAEAKAYAEGFEEVLIVDSVYTYDGSVTKIGLSNKASYDENGNYNTYHSDIALVSEDNEISIKAISGQTLELDGEKQNGTLNFGIRSVAASKVTGLADIATTGNVDDLVQTENTYIIFDCGSSSVNI